MLERKIKRAAATAVVVKKKNSEKSGSDGGGGSSRESCNLMGKRKPGRLLLPRNLSLSLLSHLLVSYRF